MILSGYTSSKNNKYRVARPSRLLPNISFEWLLSITAMIIVTTLLLSSQLDIKRLAFGNLNHIYLEGEYIHLDRQKLESIISPTIGQNLLDLDLDIFEQRFHRYHGSRMYLYNAYGQIS